MRTNELISYLDLLGEHDLLKDCLERSQGEFEEEIEMMQHDHEEAITEIKEELANSLDDLEEELINAIRTCSYESIEETIALLFTNFHKIQRLRRVE